MKKQPIDFSTSVSNPHIPGVRDISPTELSEKASAVHIIDVRRPDEYTGELGHIPGSKLVTLDTIPQHIDSLPKDEPVVFVCRSGGRSAQATGFALQSGFTHVFNMAGGMLKWNELGLKTEK